MTDTHEVQRELFNIYADNPAMSLATSGGDFSPWVLGVYYAHMENDLYFFLEESGKSLGNVTKSSKAAFLISKNDASKDFVQGHGVIEILPASQEPVVRKMITEKLPWFKTYTPVVPVKLKPSEVFVSSFQKGWFPAKNLRLP